jgi:hypothetical protein
METAAMGLDDGRPTQGKNLQGFELGGLNGSAEAAGDREPSAIEVAAQWTQNDSRIVRASMQGTDPEKPYAKQVEQLLGTEETYVRESPAQLRQAVNAQLRELEQQTGKKLGRVKPTDSFEAVEDKNAAAIVAGFGPGSQWSEMYKNSIMSVLRQGNPDISRADMTNQATIRDALLARDRKQAASVLGESAASSVSGADFERAVNQYNYRYMQKHGIKNDVN